MSVRFMTEEISSNSFSSSGVAQPWPHRWRVSLQLRQGFSTGTAAVGHLRPAQALGLDVPDRLPGQRTPATADGEVGGRSKGGKAVEGRGEAVEGRGEAVKGAVGGRGVEGRGKAVGRNLERQRKGGERQWKVTERQ